MKGGFTFLFCSLFFSNYSGFGQTVRLSGLGTDSMGVVGYVQIFVDPSQKLDIKNLHDSMFQPFTGYVEKTDFNSEVHGNVWLKLGYINDSKDTVDFDFFPGLFHEVLFYKNLEYKGKNGRFVSKNKRPHPFGGVYPFVSMPGDTSSLLVRATGDFKKRYAKLILYHPDYLQLHPPTELSRIPSYQMFYAFFFGVLFFVIIFSSIQYVQVREKAYLYYVIYLFGNLLYFLREFETWSPYDKILFSYIMEWDTHYETPLSYFIYVTYLIFVLNFLDIKKINPLLYRIGVFAIYGFVGYVVLDKMIWFGISPDASYEFRYILKYIIIAGGLVYGYFIIKSGSPLTFYIITGSLFLLVFAGCNALLSERHDAGRFEVEGFWDYPILYSQIGILIEIVFFSVGLGYKNRLEIEEKNKAVLRAMNAQMKPHFIDNCMNSLKKMVYDGDTVNTVRYLTKFSKLLRLVLVNTDKPQVTMREELEMAGLYLEMEKLRFKDHFDSTFDIDETIDLDEVVIPPLTLQPHIENALWHGLLLKEGMRLLSVEVKNENGKIKCTIEDNGIGRERVTTLSQPSKTVGKYMGIKLSKERLDLFGIELKIIDKQDMDNQPTGTKVEILINN